MSAAAVGTTDFRGYSKTRALGCGCLGKNSHVLWTEEDRLSDLHRAQLCCLKLFLQ